MGPERFPRSSQDLMNLCSRVLTVRADGSVDFRHPDSMRSFLTESRFLDRDGGDEPIARMCLRYLNNAADWCIFKPWKKIRDRSIRSSVGPFFKYAFANWHRHCQKAQNSSNDLATQLHKKLETDVISCFQDDGFLHIELKKLTLQLGLNLCRNYRFDFLHGIYSQMGADDCSMPAVIVPFPSGEDSRLLQELEVFSEHGMQNGTEWPACQVDAHRGAAADAAEVEASSVDGLTDCESALEESWGSIPYGEQADHWVLDFDELRLVDDSVTLHRLNRKGRDSDWQMVDRGGGAGS